MEKDLYLQLYNVRQQLKESEKTVTGRAPTVCSDDALMAIAEMKPRKLSDLEGVPGVGKAFITNYGQYFIDAINESMDLGEEKTVDMDNIATKTLKELEKKLVSINRRNRLLYMPKLTSKHGCDLIVAAKENPLDIIFGNGKVVTLCDLSNADVNENKKYKSIVALLREVNKDLRDKGQNDLYIGYPFVIGRIPGENFDVRCPLALFPVSVNKTATKISVSYDDTRDALYNNTLILAYYKFNNISKQLPDPVIDDVDINTFLQNLVNYYSQNDINLGIKENRFISFKEYKSAEFPKFNAGELYLEHNIILGKFQVCSSSIQKDFDLMISLGQINSLLNELLLEVNDLDYGSDAYYGDKKIAEDEKEFALSEKQLVYINELDSSQENVLSAIDNLDKMVIQGPPGTGKSQVITSLISKFASEGKTVLMVSEKKTALDVVYSRLGELSKYAMLIDDTSNKELFYKQLEKMLYNYGQYGNGIEEEIDNIANCIDENVRKLENIAESLHKVNDFGVEPYKLYIQSSRINTKNQEEAEILSRVHALITENIRSIKYSELSNIYSRFNKKDLLEKISAFYHISQEYPWLKNSIEGLNEYEVIGFNSRYSEYRNQFKEYESKNFLAKMFGKGRITKDAREFASEYFENVDDDIVEILLSNPAEIRDGFNQYAIYDESYSLYSSFTRNERAYINVLLKVEDLFETLVEANRYLFNALMFENIVKFESEHRDVLQTIGQYRDIIEKLSHEISLKKEITRKRLINMLSCDMDNISRTKRSGEIQRIIEGKRKWNVNRFISKYSFELFKGIKIWMLTPEVVSEIIPLEIGLFDLVIFDEASQMYIEKGLPAIQRAKKVIIAGDHKQLRPSSLGSGRMDLDEEDISEEMESSAALEEESLLDLARFKYQDVMLNFHYRSRYEELIAFSNYAFYKGRLYVSPNKSSSGKPPIEFHKIENAIWANRSNYAEATYIVNLLKEILSNRKNEETIGIITFNSNQRDLIMDLIDDQCAADVEFAAKIRAEMSREKDGEDIGLFIKNIESVQGDERDIIIFSIGYAKNENGRLIRNFGWLNQKGGENRLNVAISRAKYKIHIVASFEPEELQVEDSKNEGPRILKKYLQYSKAVSMNDKNGARQILYSFGDDSHAGENISFDSEFEMQVYDALNDRLSGEGFSIDTQVGIGGYSIDLAIKKNGEYILGIECDGRMYHSSKSARERDYHRQKYLESRGWRIHRIWSTNWWRNPKGEIDKIIAVIESL